MFEHAAWYNKLPNESLKVYEPHLRLFFETMYERQMIWKKRFIDKKERPWTNNKIFQESKFTNIYRELDRNSQWQIKNILLDEELSLKNLIWKLMVFRFFNNPETFTSATATKWRNGIPNWEEYDENEFSRFIAGVRNSGKNPFTSAYLINTMAAPGHSRDYCYTEVVTPYLHKNIDKIIAKVITAKNPEDIIKYLKTFPAIADFIAHEFYQDFTYIPRYTNRKFMKFDQNDFTNVGPGASIGIRLIYPNLNTVVKQKQAIYWLRDESEKWLNKIGEEKKDSMQYLYWDKIKGCYYTNSECNITLHQIEMWLCEFQKYWKMTIGQGKQRSKFQPKSKDLISK
jgi:hypothetical protein